MNPQNAYLVSILQAALAQEQAHLQPSNTQIAQLEQQIQAIRNGQGQRAGNIAALQAHIALLSKEGA